MLVSIATLSTLLSGAFVAAIEGPVKTLEGMTPIHTDHAIGTREAPTVWFTADAASDHRCGTDATFTNATSATSPLVSDCRAILDVIKNTGGGVYTLEVPGYPNEDGKVPAIVYSGGNCYFSIIPQQETQWIGSQDILDLVTNAIAFDGGSGRVAVTGTVKACQGYGGATANIDLAWSLWGYN